jgi:hypothetical protein
MPVFWPQGRMLIPGPTLLTNQRIYLSDECSNQIKEVQEKENIMNQERTGFIISLLSLFFFYLLGPSTHLQSISQGFIFFIYIFNGMKPCVQILC